MELTSCAPVVAFVHRHLWWIKFYRFLRKLWNSNDSRVFSAVETYVVMDQIEEKMIELRATPSLLRDPNWSFFSEESNPCLADYIKELKTRTQQTYTKGGSVPTEKLESAVMGGVPLTAAWPHQCPSPGAHLGEGASVATGDGPGGKGCDGWCVCRDVGVLAGWVALRVDVIQCCCDSESTFAD